MNANLEPKLAPPGAGLPGFELFIGRLIFGWRRLTGNRASFNARFEKERAAIHALVRNLEPEAGSQRVLIQRVRGLEDSSRYWSVWMALDHLRIVNQSIIRAVRTLAAGVKPEGKAGTARVKPSPHATAAVVAEYERSCDELLATVASVQDLKTKLRYAHPWFGPLDAAGWHALAGGHLGIHRVQIERILSGISGARGKVSA